MRDGRYDVRVMTSSPGDDYDYHGIHVYRFHKFALGCSDYLPFLTEPLKIHYFAKKLKAIRLSPSDIAVCHVHLFENYAPYATWLKRKNPKCQTLLHHHWTGRHELSVDKTFDWIPGLKAWLYLYSRKHLEAANAQIFCSETSKTAFGRYFPNGPLAPSVDMKTQLRFPNLFRSVRLGQHLVCYNGIDTSLFHCSHSPTSTSTPFSIPPTSTYRIGCIGNFTPQKSQATLIRAVDVLTQRHSGIEKIEVIFVGSGLKLEFCKALAASLLATRSSRLQIMFKTEVHHDLLPDFYCSLNLFVLPSYYEAFNCVFIEALGCGVPIIGCDNVSIREVLFAEDAKMWLFPPEDAEALADRIEMAMRERPPRQQLTRNLDIDVITREFVDWVDGKLAQSHGGAEVVRKSSVDQCRCVIPSCKEGDAR